MANNRVTETVSSSIWRRFWVYFVVITIGAVATFYGLIQWLNAKAPTAGVDFTARWRLNDWGELSSTIGTVFGLPIAFAGSLAAILAARAALDVAQAQERRETAQLVEGLYREYVENLGEIANAARATLHRAQNVSDTLFTAFNEFRRACAARELNARHYCLYDIALILSKCHDTPESQKLVADERAQSAIDDLKELAVDVMAARERMGEAADTLAQKLRDCLTSGITSEAWELASGGSPSFQPPAEYSSFEAQEILAKVVPPLSRYSAFAQRIDLAADRVTTLKRALPLLRVASYIQRSFNELLSTGRERQLPAAERQALFLLFLTGYLLYSPEVAESDIAEARAPEGTDMEKSKFSEKTGFVTMNLGAPALAEILRSLPDIDHVKAAIRTRLLVVFGEKDFSRHNVDGIIERVCSPVRFDPGLPKSVLEPGLIYGYAQLLEARNQFAFDDFKKA